MTEQKLGINWELKEVKNSYWMKILLIIFFVHGVLLYIFRKYQNQLCWNAFNLSEYWRYFAGYSFAILIGRLGIKPIRDIIWIQFSKVIKKKDTEPLMFFLGTLLGAVESVAYVTALIIDKAEFIAAWLAIKVVIQWKGWCEGNIGREITNSYLINSLMSVFYSIVGWCLIKWYYTANDWSRVLALPLVLWLVSWIIYCFVKTRLDKWESKEYKEWLDNSQSESTK